LLKGARLGLRVNPPSSQGVGRALRLEMMGSAGCILSTALGKAEKTPKNVKKTVF
jgi:hypothetical protein